MNFIVSLSKRKRIEELVKKSVENAELAENYVSNSGMLIADVVESFTEVSPHTYFDTSDDRKIAGLVLAYMMEIAEIDIDEANEYGYRLLKFVAKTKKDEFLDKAPHTYARLRQYILLATQLRPPDE
jgi:hypothetical protein